MEKLKIEYTALCSVMEERYGCADYNLSEKCLQIARNASDILKTTSELLQYAFAIYQAHMWSNKVNRDNVRIQQYNKTHRVNTETGLY